MPTPIDIKIRISDDGTGQILDVTANKVQGIGEKAGKARSGVSEFVKGFTDLRTALDTAGDAMRIVGDFERLGAESLKAKLALDSLSGGQTNQYLAAMRAQTRGLVDDFNLTQSATKSLGLNLVTTADQAADLAKVGTILGQTFRGDAKEGVETLTIAMMRVGLVGLLDNIGISGTKVKQRFEELKATMGDQQAWSMAVLEVGKENAKKLESQLDSTGTAVERLGVKFENFKRGAAENVAIGVEAIVGGTQAIIDYAQQAELAAAKAAYFSGQQITLNQFQALRGAGYFRTPDELADQHTANYNAMLAGQKAQVTDAQRYGRREDLAMRREYEGQAYGGTGISPINDLRRNAEMASEMDMWRKAGAAGGTTAASWQTNQAYAAAQQQKDLQEGVKLLGTLWQNATGQVQAHLSAVSQITQPIREQISLMERRAKIQSFDQAFGLQRDGLYGEFGSAMSADAQAYRQKVEADLRRRIGTASRGYTPGERAQLGAYDEQAAAARRQYQEQLYAESHAKGYRRLPGEATSDAKLKAYDKQQAQARAKYQRQQRIGGKVYTKKDYEGDLAKIDREIKQGMDEYAIATGQATKESIAFRDLQASISKQVREGAMSVRDQARAYLEMTNAMKDGKVSMEEYYDLQYKYGTPDQKKQVSVYRKRMADEERFAGKGKGDAVDANDPYSGVAKSADVATKNTDALGQAAMNAATLIIDAGVRAASGMSPTISAVQKAQGEIKILQGLLSGMVGALSINIGFSAGGGSSRNDTGATNAGQSAKGKAF